MNKPSILQLEMMENPGGAWVKVFVDGENLGEKLSSVAKSSDTYLPWSHAGDVFMGYNTIMNEDIVDHGGDQVVIFACDCGNMSRSNLHSQVVIEQDHLVFRDFVGNSGPIDQDPVRFDRRQFRQEIQRFKAQYDHLRDRSQWLGDGYTMEEFMINGHI